MADKSGNVELRIRTDPGQVEAVIAQIGKEFELAPIAGESSASEQLFTITPRRPPQTLPPISVIFVPADDPDPLTPSKRRALICNPVYAGIEPYVPSLVHDERWVSAAALMVRREGVEAFLVNMLYTIQTALGVEGQQRPSDDVPLPEQVPLYPEDMLGIERPVNLRLSADDKDVLKRITAQLGLVLVLYGQKHSGKAGVKHFAAKLSDVKRDLPALTAKYVPPQQIFAQPPGFTDEFLAVLADPNVAWSLFGNPLYTGAADFPRLMPDERWLRGASILMRESGIEAFLVNMLYLMRRSARDWQKPETRQFYARR